MKTLHQPKEHTFVEKDHSLYERVRQGDQAALQTLYERYYPRLCRFVGQFVQDVDQAQEVINDVFMAIWQSKTPFESRSQFSTWVMGIAYRKAISAVNKSAKHQHLEEIQDSTISTDQSALQFDMDVQRIAKRLNPRQKAITELTFYFGYTYKEVGEILSCPENTVKTTMLQIRKTLASLRDLYKPQ